MEEVQLSMENPIGIRLAGISFTSARDATVEFELYSGGNQVEDGQKLLARIPQEVPLHNLRTTGLPDYDGMVKEAAKKLEKDFGRVVEMLNKVFRVGLPSLNQVPIP